MYHDSAETFVVLAIQITHLTDHDRTNTNLAYTYGGTRSTLFVACYHYAVISTPKEVKVDLGTAELLPLW